MSRLLIIGGNQKMLPEQRGIYRDYDCKQNQVKM